MRNYCTASDPGGVTILNSSALSRPALKPRPSIAGEARATFYPGVPIQALTGEPWLTAAIPVASLCCSCVLTSGAAATCSERAEKALASVRVLPVFSPSAFETLLLPPSYLLLMDGVLRVWAGAAHVDGSLSGPYLRSPSSHPLSPLSSLHSSSLLLCTLTQLGPAPRPAGPLLRSYIRRIDASNQGLIIKDLLKKGPKANWTHRCG